MIASKKDLMQKMESHIDADRLAAAYAYNVQVDSADIALRGLRDKNVNIQRAWAVRNDYPVTSEVMDLLVFSPYHKLREQACKKNYHLSPEHLQHLLSDKHAEVVSSLLQRKDIEVPKKYLEEGLRSELRELYEDYVHRMQDQKLGDFHMDCMYEI